jgi:hypothetical protein
MDLFRRLFSQSEAKTENATPVPEEQKVPPRVDTSSSIDTAPVTQQPELPSMPEGATRPLPPETAISSSNEHLTFGQSTDIGMVRTNNQDSALSYFFTSRSAEQRPDFGLFIVADGMGGHHDGEKASALTTRTVASYVTNHVYLPILTGDNDADRPPITEALIAAVQKANADIIVHVPEGGTTATAVAVVGDLAYIAHVGDISGARPK